MTPKPVLSGVLAGLFATGAIATTVSAQTAATATGLSVEQVIEIALDEVPGEVQELEMETEDGQQVWEVEILAADGSSMEVEIDAQSGDVLEIDTEDRNDEDDRSEDHSEDDDDDDDDDEEDDDEDDEDEDNNDDEDEDEDDD